jgi:hypothetical protein
MIVFKKTKDGEVLGDIVKTPMKENIDLVEKYLDNPL